MYKDKFTFKFYHLFILNTHFFKNVKVADLKKLQEHQNKDNKSVCSSRLDSVIGCMYTAANDKSFVNSVRQTFRDDENFHQIDTEIKIV